MKEFLSVKDIMGILQVQRTKALEIMHRFIQNGQGFKDGHVLRVRQEIFYGWLAQQDGYGIKRKPLRAIAGGKAAAGGRG
ncbi:hypothetical protein FACS1894184_08610 [Clostridia bacterium]|nr:hypothetical protein FACS1894184_08610 [Clostridia bacterium]GHU76458.1 hypothetical protein AGMMS49992_22160 [Clostridia bacterium]